MSESFLDVDWPEFALKEHATISGREGGGVRAEPADPRDIPPAA
jgi:hypothetical protein